MNGKKISGLILILIGAFFIVFTCVLAKKVQQGEVKIRRSQKAVDTIREYGDMNPRTKTIGRITTNPAQQKIDEGKKKAVIYKGVASWGFISGIVLAAGGVVLFVLGFVCSCKSKKLRRTTRKTAKRRKK